MSEKISKDNRERVWVNAYGNGVVCMNDPIGQLMYFSQANVQEKRGWDVDHIVPISQKGTNELVNLHPVSRLLNEKKANKKSFKIDSNIKVSITGSLSKIWREIFKIKERKEIPCYLVHIKNNNLRYAVYHDVVIVLDNQSKNTSKPLKTLRICKNTHREGIWVKNEYSLYPEYNLLTTKGN